MKILALDASTKSTGVALFNDNTLTKYACFTASSTDVIKRIKNIISDLSNFMSENTIDKIILEEVRPETGINLSTYRALMWLQAAINFMVHEHYPKVKIEYVYPNSWRAACGIRTGRGIKREELKKADIEFVKNTYNLTVNDDIADAIGIGHSFIHQLSNEVNWE